MPNTNILDNTAIDKQYVDEHAGKNILEQIKEELDKKDDILFDRENRSIVRKTVLDKILSNKNYAAIDTDHIADQIVDILYDPELSQAVADKQIKQCLNNSNKSEVEINIITKNFCIATNNILLFPLDTKKGQKTDKEYFADISSFTNALSEDKQQKFKQLFGEAKGQIIDAQKSRQHTDGKAEGNVFNKIKKVLSNFFDKVAGLFGQDKCSKAIKGTVQNFNKSIDKEILVKLAQQKESAQTKAKTQDSHSATNIPSKSNLPKQINENSKRKNSSGRVK